MQSRTYRISANAAAEQIPRVRRRSITGLVMMFCFLALLLAINLKGKHDRFSVTGLIVLILLHIPYSFRTLQKMTMRLRQEWASFELTINEDRVVRRMEGYPAIEILKKDIARIELKTEGFKIKSHRRGDEIWVPRMIESYEQVKDELVSSTNAPIRIATALLSTIAPYLVPLIIVGVLFSFLSATRFVWVMALGSALTILIVWSLFSIQVSRLFNARTKRASWALLLALFGVLGKMAALYQETH